MHGDETTARLVLRALAVGVLSGLASLVIWSLLPAALGWHPSVVMSGSMRPAIEPGDIVVVRSAAPEQLRVHQVVLVPDPDHAGRLRLHRIHQIGPDSRLVLRGDANRSADSSLVRATDVMGVGVLRVPLIGSAARAMRAGQWGQVTAMTATLAMVVALASRGSGSAGDGSPRPSKPRRGARSLGHGPRRRRTSLALRTVLVVAALLVGLSSSRGYAAFGVNASNPVNSFSAAASFYPYRNAVLADSPVLYWRVGEASGTVAANSASTGPAGTYYSSPSMGQVSALTSEVVNKSISTLASGYVTAATATTAPAQFSVEAWIRTSTATGGRILGFGNGGTTTLSTNTDRQLYLSPTGKVVAGLRNAALVKTVATSPLSYNDNLWHHVAATYNGATLRLYVDGAQVATTNTTTAATFSGYWRAATENLTGWPTAPSNNRFAGGLDELAVYATALSATRVSAHYAAATG